MNPNDPSSAPARPLFPAGEFYLPPHLRRPGPDPAAARRDHRSLAEALRSLRDAIDRALPAVENAEGSRAAARDPQEPV